MKSLNHITMHGKVWLRAVEREEGSIVELSNRMSLPHHQLKEVLLMPQDAPAITKEFLVHTPYHSVDDLLAIYEGRKAIMYRDHVYLVKNKILGHFFINLPYQNALWNFSIHETADGPVISVVVGNQVAMNKMYEKEKNRKRPRALVLQV